LEKYLTTVYKNLLQQFPKVSTWELS